jgi:hypothetical protein
MVTFYSAHPAEVGDRVRVVNKEYPGMNGRIIQVFYRGDNTPIQYIVKLDNHREVYCWTNEIYEPNPDVDDNQRLDEAREIFSRLMAYRERNTLNFQLEKLDDYLRELGAALND